MNRMIAVKNTDQLRDVLVAGYQPHQIRFDKTAALADVREAAEAAGFEHGKREQSADSLEAAVLAERERILGIESLSQAGFEREVIAAIAKGTTRAAFATEMVREINDRGVTLDAIRRDAPNPAPHASAPDDRMPSKPKAPSAEAAYARRRIEAGHGRKQPSDAA
jgi:hypothetical protein